MSKKSIAVSQYEGKKLVAKYRSIAEAASLTGVQPAHIGKVANGLRNTAGGFNWKSMKTFSSKMKNGVTQTDSKGVLAVYADADIAARYTGVRASAISKALSGKSRTAGGFGWS